jgi:hypothetical protein
LAEAKPAPCQVRDKTGNPCPRRAEVEILGGAFCGACAREQEAYFAIGELTEEGARDHRGEALTEALAEALEKMRRRRVGSKGEIVARRKYHGPSRIDKSEPLVLRSG